MLRAREVHQRDAALDVVALHKDATETRRPLEGGVFAVFAVDVVGFYREIHGNSMVYI